MSLIDQIRAAPDGGETRAPIPFFNGQELSVGWDAKEGWTPDGAIAALRNFLALGPADSAAAAPHLFAYWSDVAEAVGPECALEPGRTPPAGPEDIWRLVEPRHLQLDYDRRDAAIYVVLEAECAWEPEHGLMMCWRDGAKLTKVSGYDGHVSNVRAYARPELADVVYKGSDERFTTRTD